MDSHNNRLSIIYDIKKRQGQLLSLMTSSVKCEGFLQVTDIERA